LFRVQRFNIKCLIRGHEDLLRYTPTRLYLLCAQCGRETRGWKIDNARARRGEPRSGFGNDSAPLNVKPICSYSSGADIGKQLAVSKAR
jgi:hypothetical protein